MFDNKITFLVFAIISLIYSFYILKDIIKYNKNKSYQIKRLNSDIFEFILSFLISIFFIFYALKGIK